MEDCAYRQTSIVLPIKALVEYFNDVIQADPETELFLARPSIVPESLFNEVIVTLWSRSQAIGTGPVHLDHERNVIRDRFLFGLSRKYRWGKAIRWDFEKHLSLAAPRNQFVTRNNAMRPPVSAIKMFEHTSATDTDSIQEFFIPIPRFLGFMDETRTLMEEMRTNLLGVTIRYVKQNSETALAYSPREDMFAVIIYFNEVVSRQGRQEADALINRLTRLAIEHRGTFYLTYVRDVAHDDLRRAYPGIERFFQQKFIADPECRFSNRFFEAHGRASVALPATIGECVATAT